MNFARPGLLALLLTIPFSSVATAGPGDPVTLSTVGTLEEENGPILRWLEEQRSRLAPWMAKRGSEGGPPDYLDFRLDPSPTSAGLKKKRPTRSAERLQEARETKALYNHYFPPNDPSSTVGTFFESGHPYIETSRGPYQWNSLKQSGMEDPALFRQAVEKLAKRGMKSFRIGPNLHEIDPRKPKTFEKFLSQLETIWLAGGTPTISVAFFPSLKRWEVKDRATGKVDYAKSYVHHEHWPRDMGEITEAMMTQVWRRAEALESRLGRKLTAVINPINEPETLAAFGVHFWHWPAEMRGIPEARKFYVASTLRIAEANVAIRLAAEKTAGGRRLVFMHNEAMTPDYYPSHSGGGRFAVSKFMLGDPVLTTRDFDAYLSEPVERMRKRLFAAAESGTLDEVEWALKEYIFGSWNTTPEAQAQARSEIVASMKNLQASHREFVATTGKRMSTDVMLLLDYYYQTEFQLARPVERLADELASLDRMMTVLDTRNENEIVRMLRDVGAPAEFGVGDLRNPAKLRAVLAQNEFSVLAGLVGLRREPNGAFLLGFEPQHAGRQMRFGIREGLASFLTSYFNGIGIYVGGVGEAGTPFHTFAAPLHEQMRIDLAAVLAAEKIYGTQYAFGPAVDTKGWAKAPLGLHYLDDHATNPSGLLSVRRVRGKKGAGGVREVTERSWVAWFLDPVFGSARAYARTKECRALLQPPAKEP